MNDANIIGLKQLAKGQQLVYIQKIAEWYQSEWGKYRPDKSLEDWKIKNSNTDFPIVLVAVDDTKCPTNLAGVIKLKHDDLEGVFPNQKLYRISGLYVAPAYRKQGIGLRLIKHAALLAHTRGAKEIWLFTHSAKAEEFYLRHQWQYQFNSSLYKKQASILKAKISDLLL